MSPDPARAAVVVAVDDLGTAADAVDWASAEAATRQSPLRIVHAVPSPLPDPYCIAAATDNPFTARATAAEQCCAQLPLAPDSSPPTSR